MKPATLPSHNEYHKFWTKPRNNAIVEKYLQPRRFLPFEIYVSRLAFFETNVAQFYLICVWIFGGRKRFPRIEEAISLMQFFAKLRLLKWIVIELGASKRANNFWSAAIKIDHHPTRNLLFVARVSLFSFNVLPTAIEQSFAATGLHKGDAIRYFRTFLIGHRFHLTQCIPSPDICKQCLWV